MVRVITFQSSLIWIGITGCPFRMSCVLLFEPVLELVFSGTERCRDHRSGSAASWRAQSRRPHCWRRAVAIDGALRLVVTAAEGERNAVLHWAACRLGERVRAGQIGAGEAEGLLVAAGSSAGLIEREARATARSGLRRMD